MSRTDRKVFSSSRRATDELLLARLLGLAEQLSESSDEQADEQLLRALLLAPQSPAAPHRRSLRMLLLVLTAMLALFSCVPLASAAGSLLAIRNNVAAMRLTEVESQRSQVAGRTLEVANGAPLQPKGAREPEYPTGTAAIEPPAVADTAPIDAHGGGDTPPSTLDHQAPARTQPVAASVAPAVAAPQQIDANLVSSDAEPAASPAEQPAAASEQVPVAVDNSLRRSRPSTFDLRPATIAVEPAPEAAVTVLLLGVDRRPEQTGPARADSVIVARIDPQGGRVALVSFPRDLLVEIPGVGWDRINSMTVYGDMYPELGGSLDLSRRTVETLLGIPIDHAVSVDFGGFISAVDALGGITVNVEREVYDSFTENHFAAGPQHMDGRTALWYSRIRFLDNDFERMRRQQSVLLGLLSRIRDQNALQQLHSIAAVTGALRGYIQTDLPEDRMVRLAWGLRNVAPDSVEQYRLEVDQVDIFVNAADPYAQYIRAGAAESLVRKLMGSAP